MIHCSKKRNAVLQPMRLAHLQKIDELGTVSAYEELDMWEEGTDTWCGCDEEVDTLAVGKSRDHDNRD